MVAKQLIVAAFMLGVAWAQLDDPAVDKALSNLPPDLQGKVDANQVEDLKNKSTQAFKEKCEKNGGPDAFTKAENAFTDLKSCMEGLVNRTVLEEEIELAKPNGKIDEVFKKYCGMKSQFKGCLKTALDAAKPCFSKDEQRNLKTINNVTEQLAEFVCFKDGDRIALFIAEGGPECFSEQQDAIQECVNSTLGADIRLDPTSLSADNLPEISFGPKECSQLTKIQTCVVSNLEKCPQPTTANIAESLFKYIRKGTPCKAYTEDKPANARTTNKEDGQKQKPDSASAIAVTSLTFIMAAATLLV